MATQSNHPAHSEKFREDEDAISANIFSSLPAQLQYENQSYDEASDEFSEDDNELYGFLQTALISSTPDTTSSQPLHYNTLTQILRSILTLVKHQQHCQQHKPPPYRSRETTSQFTGFQASQTPFI